MSYLLLLICKAMQSLPLKNREAGFPRLWVSSVLYTFDALQMSDNKFGDHLKPNDNLQLLILFLITLFFCDLNCQGLFPYG